MADVKREGEALVVRDEGTWLKLTQAAVGCPVVADIGDRHGRFGGVTLTKEDVDDVIAKLEAFRRTMGE